MTAQALRSPARTTLAQIAAVPIRKRSSIGSGSTPPDPPPLDSSQLDSSQVVVRGCTLCDYEARVVEAMGADPLCPWCYGPTERRSVIGVIMPEHVAPGQKNPYAASLGRLGGLKGGPARAHKLSARQRREIAIKAARARWGNKKKR
jgi:hypothetical protein